MESFTIKNRNRLAWCGVLVASVAVSFLCIVVAESNAGGDGAAVERTRKQVRMLDDLYKNVVVLITDKYVEDKTDFAAGSAAVQLFKAMKKKGWHEVRLLDATGRPRRSKNAPQDDFERKAVAAMNRGESYIDSVVDIDGVKHLRAATPVPVVSEKCIMCHSHYADAKEGAAIGALSYTLKVE